MPSKNKGESEIFRVYLKEVKSERASDGKRRLKPYRERLDLERDKRNKDWEKHIKESKMELE